MFYYFQQKTAYDMRISDWSSDVCSSDLVRDGSNQTMLREARILAALRDTTVPHPQLITACDDTSVIGTCFYLMQPLEGFAQSGEQIGRAACRESGCQYV